MLQALQLTQRLPLDLKTKDELRAYAYYKWKMMHIASNYLDLVYDNLDSRLTMEDKLEVLRKMIDWWSTPEYLDAVKQQSDPTAILKLCKDYAKRAEKDRLRQSDRSS